MNLPTVPRDPRLRDTVLNTTEFNRNTNLPDPLPTNTNTFEDSLDIVKKHIQKVEKECSNLFAGYMALYNQDPSSDVTKAALETFNERYDHLKKLQSMVDFTKEKPVAENAIDGTSASVNQKSPNTALDHPNITGLLFLQLYDDSPSAEKRRNFATYRTPRDFCTAFEAMMVENRLTFNKDWERTLPLCLNEEDNAWFKNEVMGKKYQWRDARMMLIERKQTAFTRMYMMMEVCNLRQDNKSIRSYAYQYQNFCKEAHVSDGTMLATQFLVSLRTPVREAVFSALEASKILPRNLTEMIDYVLEINPSGFSGKRGRTANIEKKLPKKAKSEKGAKALKDPKTRKDNPCRWCGDPFTPAHKCQQYYDHKNSLFIKR